MAKGRETADERLVRMTQRERALWALGVFHGGVDEVGRGALAGPVVAACVAMPSQPLLPWVNDSKKVAPGRRERLDEMIRAVAGAVGIGVSSVEEIARLNIRGATRLAMERAVANTQVEFVFTDAEQGLSIRAEQEAIVRGDAVSYQIAAASIVAKVYRDRLMARLGEQYPDYGFSRNKGYGTAGHIDAIRRLGPCPLHRPLFLRGILEGEQLRHLPEREHPTGKPPRPELS